MVYPEFEKILFENRAKERVKQTYAVLYYLKNGARRRDAIAKASDYFPQIKDRSQTIESKISTQIGVTLDTFFEWYNNGTSLSELTQRLDLNEHDNNIFAELLNTNTPELQSLPEEVKTISEELFEGSVKTISMDIYERNPEARNICIDHYGAICAVCEFEFYDKYGSVGEGYIHVHHLKPISDIRENYPIDPIRDLRPICPNCHSIIHLRKPPYTIEEMKRVLKTTT